MGLQSARTRLSLPWKKMEVLCRSPGAQCRGGSSHTGPGTTCRPPRGGLWQLPASALVHGVRPTRLVVVLASCRTPTRSPTVPVPIGRAFLLLGPLALWPATRWCTSARRALSGARHREAQCRVRVQGLPPSDHIWAGCSTLHHHHPLPPRQPHSSQPVLFFLLAHTSTSISPASLDLLFPASPTNNSKRRKPANRPSHFTRFRHH